MSYKKKPKIINPDEVDPSVYYYDEVYDDMKRDSVDDDDKNHSKSSSSKKESKYVKGIQSSAELRKTESELRRFRKYARDREEAEASGDLSKEEVFITPKYERKLKEMRKLEEEKSRRLAEDYSNAMNVFKDNKTVISKASGTQLAKHETKPEQGDSKFIQDEQNESSELIRPLPRKKLVTLDDRREYLREFLKKRTVGRVYEEAVQRYKQRKAARIKQY